MKTELESRVREVEALLDLSFTNKVLLLQALTHRSYLNEHADHPVGSYERLEFLGDGVLNMIVAEQLFKRHPEADEGELTRHRSVLVSTAKLGEIACSMGLHTYVLLARGTLSAFMQEGSREHTYIPGCVIEALIGALFLDQGLGACRFFVDHLLMRQASRLVEEFVDYMSLFQNTMQARHGITPRYRIVNECGSDHDKTYTVACLMNGLLVATGTGKSKKYAKFVAATIAHTTISHWEKRLREVT